MRPDPRNPAPLRGAAAGPRRPRPPRGRLQREAERVLADAALARDDGLRVLAVAVLPFPRLLTYRETLD